MRLRLDYYRLVDGASNFGYNINKTEYVKLSESITADGDGDRAGDGNSKLNKLVYVALTAHLMHASAMSSHQARLVVRK